MYGAKAPALTEAGFKTGCSQPGEPKPLVSNVIDLGIIKISFAEDKVFITTKNPMIQKLLEAGAKSVGNRSVSVSLEQ